MKISIFAPGNAQAGLWPAVQVTVLSALLQCNQMKKKAKTCYCKSFKSLTTEWWIVLLTVSNSFVIGLYTLYTSPCLSGVHILNIMNESYVCFVCQQHKHANWSFASIIRFCPWSLSSANHHDNLTNNAGKNKLHILSALLVSGHQYTIFVVVQASTVTMSAEEKLEKAPLAPVRSASFLQLSVRDLCDVVKANRKLDSRKNVESTFDFKQINELFDNLWNDFENISWNLSIYQHFSLKSGGVHNWNKIIC